MLKEAIDRIVNLGRQAASPENLNIDDPTKARYVTGDGEVVEVPLGHPPRKHRVKQLADIIAMAARFAEDVDYVPAVFYDESAVVLVIDDESYRAETATLELVESDAFRVVRSLAGGTKAPTFDHKSFVRLLRLDLAGALAPSELLDIVRRVKFESGNIVSSEVRKSRESLGREITSAVNAESDIPDDVTLSVPVYKTAGEDNEYPVRCSIEVDPLQGRFALTPYPDEIQRVQHLATASIAERLAAALPEGVYFYFGSPG